MERDTISGSVMFEADHLPVGAHAVRGRPVSRSAIDRALAPEFATIQVCARRRAHWIETEPAGG